MKKRILSLLTAAIMIFSLIPTAFAATATQFKDQADITYTEAVNTLVGLGVISGMGQNQFQPHGTLTRAQGARLIAMVKTGANETTIGYYTGNTKFTDVTKNHNWANTSINYCVASSIIAGQTANTFNPDGSLTGSALVKMMLIVLGYSSKTTDPTTTLTGANWEENAIRMATETGLFTGLSADFSATRAITREEACQIMFNALNVKDSGGKTFLETVFNATETTDILPESVNLNVTSCTIKIGDTKTLTATVRPSDAKDKTVTWKSSNTSVATVSSGVIKGIKAGTATITVTTANGKTAQCAVTVQAVESDLDTAVKVESIALSTTSCSIAVGSTQSITATVFPYDAKDKTITWKSSNTSVVTVSSGVIKGIKAGTATITATTANGKTAQCRVTVEQESNFVVPLLNHEYGPMVVTTYYSGGTYWFSNQISSLVFTKIESGSTGQRYNVYISMQGVTDYSQAEVTVYFYDSNNRVLDQVRFFENVAKDADYNILTSRWVEKDVIDNAVRIAFFSYSGDAASK